MPQNQKVVARGRVAVQRVVDFTVGGIDSHLKDTDLNTAAVRNGINTGFFKFIQVNTIRFTWSNGNGFHRGSCDLLAQSANRPF